MCSGLQNYMYKDSFISGPVPFMHKKVYEHPNDVMYFFV